MGHHFDCQGKENVELKTPDTRLNVHLPWTQSAGDLDNDDRPDRKCCRGRAKTGNDVLREHRPIAHIAWQLNQKANRKKVPQQRPWTQSASRRLCQDRETDRKFSFAELGLSACQPRVSTKASLHGLAPGVLRV